MEEGYNTVKEIGRVKLNFNRSIFYGISLPLQDNPHRILSKIKEEYLSATHYCWAYRKFPSEEYYSDGGEPSGSAGRPILNALKEYNLWDSMVIVVRYFGGVKLGIKRLISAYYLTSKSAIESGGIIKKVRTLDFSLVVSYEYFSKIKNEILRNFSSEVEEEFLDKVILRVKIPESKKSDFEGYLLRREGMGIVRRL